MCGKVRGRLGCTPPLACPGCHLSLPCLGGAASAKPPLSLRTWRHGLIGQRLWVFIWVSIDCLGGLWFDGDKTIGVVVFLAQLVVLVGDWLCSCKFRSLIKLLNHWCVSGFPLFLRQPCSVVYICFKRLEIYPGQLTDPSGKLFGLGSTSVKHLVKERLYLPGLKWP